ncbi:hypothetical protein Agub_g11620 [Astrephomene gubernaculifera]|uniref:Uncharacterized protein n=1 Tax=Astrephomene gubernaculifera TaxID=47775 RepID=A0AAD3DXA6_9CHLO|nr:hypothetical protein Agub_g11620 [Astrephomene gubernaculifera]
MSPVATSPRMRSATMALATPAGLRFARLPIRPVGAPLRRVPAPSKAIAESATSNGAPVPQAQAAPVQPVAPAAPAPAPAPAGPTQTTQILAPAAIYAAAAAAGAYKSKISLPKAFVMGILAGVYIGFGALLSFTLLNYMPGLVSSNPGLAKLIAAAVFPMGLALIIVCGAELFTGNSALMTAALLEGKANFSDVLVRWVVVYAGNAVGCLAMAAAVAATGLWSANTVIPALAVAKSSLPVAQALVRSVLCNWMVCLAVWMALSASSLPGKLMGLWLPITAFVTVGLEHSIANIFIIPMGMMLGAPVSVGQFLTANLLPVTLGNFIAGAVCTAGLYSICFGKLGANL